MGEILPFERARTTESHAGSVAGRGADVVGLPFPGARLRSVSCPRCAGRLVVRDGDGSVWCDSCGMPFRVVSSGGFERRYFPVKVEKLLAVGKAAGWLRTWSEVPDDIGESCFVDARLLYVPIWEVRAYVVGWEFGKKFRTKTDVIHVGGEDQVRTRMVEEAVEDGFFNERRLYREATDLSGLGMGRPHITGRDLTLPYLAGELESHASVLEADRALEQVREQARRSFLRPPTGTFTRRAHLFLIRESAALIYYPLWSLRYEYRGRAYDMTVDGRNGEVHSARAPADNRARLAGLLASLAALAVGLALLVSAWESWEGGRQPVAYGVLAVVVASVTILWRFRLVREVEHHETFSS
jgi:hypothetical protein